MLGEVRRLRDSRLDELVGDDAVGQSAFRQRQHLDRSGHPAALPRRDSARVTHDLQRGDRERNPDADLGRPDLRPES